MNEFIKVPATKQSLDRRSLVCGVGINDADYNVTVKINGKSHRCLSYTRWAHMLERCYSDKFKKANVTYTDCSACDLWLTFSNFDKWFEQNNIKGYDLDKDIKIKGNKIYSPETCLFLPVEINTLLTADRVNKGEFPTGVYFQKPSGKFIAQIRINKRSIHIGLFKTPSEAAHAYSKAKNKEIKSKMIDYPEFAQYLVNHLTVL